MAAVTPAVQLALDAADYVQGAEMRLTVTENLSAKHTFAVTDPKTSWTPVAGSEADKTIVYRADAPATDSVVTVRLTRTWDGKSATATIGYAVKAPASAMLVGWSMSPNPHPGDCGVARCYDPSGSDVDTAVNTHHVKRLALTSQDDTKSGSTVVSRLKAVLAQHPGVEIDYAHENEVDRHRAGDIPQWAQEHKNIQDAIRAASLPGVKTAIDLTAYNTRQGIGEKFLAELKRIGALPDVLAASMYPAGRQKTPPVESPMADHIDLFPDLAAKYGIQYVSCWEIGTPISSNYDRAALVTKWVRRLRDYSLSKGVEPRSFLWWDNDIGIDNRFAADGSTATVQGKTQKALLAA